MTLPRITIAIPFYNAEKYIEQAIAGALGQTYPNIELLLLDDGSTDNSLQIAETAMGNAAKCRIIQQENCGRASARNRLVAEASGDYLFFLDADDVIDPTVIEKLFKLSERYQSGMVLCGRYTIRESGREKITNAETLTLNWDLRSAYSCYLDHTYFKGFVTGKLFKKSIFSGIKFPEGKIYEDVAVLPDLLFKSDNVTYLSERLYGYRRTSTGVANTANALDLFDLIEALGAAGRYVENTQERYRYASFVRMHLGVIIRRKLPHFACDANRQFLEGAIFEELSKLEGASFLLDRKLKLKIKLRMAMWYFGYKFQDCWASPDRRIERQHGEMPPCK